MNMTYIAFLRALMPTGKNSIPSMKRLAEVLTVAGYEGVRTYIQSGNIILRSKAFPDAIGADIHRLIAEHFGADLQVIVKTVDELRRAINESPFKDNDDPTCVFLALSNQTADPIRLRELQQADFVQQKVMVGDECIHLWLPWDAKPKRLSNAFLEKHLGITSTMRNIRVARKIYELAIQQNETHGGL